MASIDRYVSAVIVLATFLGRYIAFGLVIIPRSPICLSQKQKTETLSCTLNETLANSPANWSFQWYLGGEQLGNTTTINYPNKSITTRLTAKVAGLFTCVLRQPNITTNRSVTVGIKPTAVANLVSTPIFTSDEHGYNYVEVSWLNQGAEYAYRFFFAIKFETCPVVPCPKGEIKPACSDTQCRAHVETDGHVFSQLTFYILTRLGMCESRSKLWKYNLSLFSCDALEPNTLPLIPFAPTRLSIQISYRRVTLRWTDIVQWLPTVLLNYTCSNIRYTMQLKSINARIISLSDKDIPDYSPYAICTFCVSVQEQPCGHFSEPLCNTTRLSEEPPSEAPSITCSTDTCPSTNDNEFRNFTVTWSLPSEKTWGGILREIKLYYIEIAADSTWCLVLITDVKLKHVVLENLNKTSDYKVYLKACNRQGCSGKSKELLVSRIMRPRSKTLKENSDSINIEDIWYVPVAGVCAVIVLIAMFVICYKRLSARNQVDLPKLSETGDQYSFVDDEAKYSDLDRNASEYALVVNESDAQAENASETA